MFIPTEHQFMIHTLLGTDYLKKKLLPFWHYRKTHTHSHTCIHTYIHTQVHTDDIPEKIFILWGWELSNLSNSRDRSFCH